MTSVELFFIRVTMYRTLRQAYTSAPLRRAASGDSFSVVNADASNASFNIYHKTSLALIAITPFALAFGGTTVGKGVDLAMGLAIPVHAHIGMNWVITDYVRVCCRAAASASLPPARVHLRLSLDTADHTLYAWCAPTLVPRPSCAHHPPYPRSFSALRSTAPLRT